MKKKKTVFISMAKANKWIAAANCFAQSLILPNEALKQFNGLSVEQRFEIRRENMAYEHIRKEHMSEVSEDETENQKNSEWMMSILVDANIIAAEFGVDPLCIMMCVKPSCKLNENVYIKK